MASLNIVSQQTKEEEAERVEERERGDQFKWVKLRNFPLIV
jgi:hypothetical protein